MQKLLTFKQAIEQSKNDKRYLLLGNGFSISWNENVFRYESLLKQAEGRLSDSAKKSFKALGTTDFEYLMKVLNDASKLVPIYTGGDKSVSKQMINDHEELKKVLISTIAENHPEKPDDISDKEYDNAIAFLSLFNGKIFTLNYDLILYWVMMKAYDQSLFDCKDGFINPDVDADYVIWDTSGSNRPTVYYLHGALHLFDSGTELKKFTWIRTQKRLIEQITSALEQGLYPLFVSEGESSQKKEHIRHNDYLSKGLQSFSEIGPTKNGEGSLFIFGHSLSDNDDHILDLIPSSNITNLYISVFGSLESDSQKAKDRKIERLKHQRQEIIRQIKSTGKRTYKKPLQVYYYDAKTANVWR